MLFWVIAIAVTAIACAALYFAAAGRRVNAAAQVLGDSNSHFRLVLAGIDADLAQGRLGEAEARAAKAELAREVLRQKAETRTGASGGPQLGRGALAACTAAVAALALGSYAWLGSPQLPSQPLAGRAELTAANIDIDMALTRIEEQLARTPDDVRGWSVIAPVYMQSGRYADAERAYRRIIELAGPTADTQTSLAEALMWQSNGQGDNSEAMDLLRAAAASDPAHILSRLYIAAELTRTGRYDEAVPAWEELVGMAKGDEPWLTAVREGLQVAQNQGAPAQGTGPGASAAEADMIAAMVQSLAGRLETSGGTIEEWTQLVRAYLVLGDTSLAQSAYDKAVAAYPRAFDRGDLDTIALDAGLKLNGAAP
jgi:cytochrome c-type biogenesis protein CcmH